MNLYENISFRPRNGGIILKVIPWIARMLPMAFQSPQWGSNSKGDIAGTESTSALFQSP